MKNNLILACFLLGFSAFISAQTGYLKIPDIEGDSKAREYQSWIDIDSFLLGMQAKAQSTGAGRTRGSVDHSEVEITKKIDKASVYLMKSVHLQKLFSQLELVIPQAGNSKKFIKYTFDGVQLKGYEVNITSNENLESLKFSYRKLKVVMYEQLSNGTLAQHEIEMDLASGR